MFLTSECRQQKTNPASPSRRLNVATSMVGVKNGHIRKHLTKKGEPHMYSWERRGRKRRGHLGRVGSTHSTTMKGQRKIFVSPGPHHAGCWLVGCLTSQQYDGVSQGRICSDKCTCWDTVADQILYLTQSQYTNTGPTSPSADPITAGVWQGGH